jgi:2-oxoisovalerate dehydrogenase E1 component alpha subunit
MKGRQLPIMYSTEGRLLHRLGQSRHPYPQAVGWAMASAYKGDDKIAAAWIGDGSHGGRRLPQRAHFAGVYRAPVILNIVNNQWAISSFQASPAARRRPSRRGHRLRHSGLRVDGNDFLAVYAARRNGRRAGALAIRGRLRSSVHLSRRRHSDERRPSRYRPAERGSPGRSAIRSERLKEHLIGSGDGRRTDSPPGQELADRAVRETSARPRPSARSAGAHAAELQARCSRRVRRTDAWHQRRQRSRSESSSMPR